MIGRRFGRCAAVLLGVGLSLAIVAGPAAGPAAAETVYGPVVTGSVDGARDETSRTGDKINGMGGGFKCNVSAYWVVAEQQGPGNPGVGYQVPFDYSCETGWNMVDEQATMWLAGTGCSVAPVGIDPDGSGSFVFPASDCVVTQVCWVIGWNWATNPYGAHSSTGCSTFPLGAPPDAEKSTSTCPYGTPLRPRVFDDPLNDAGSFGRVMQGTINQSIDPTEWALGIVVRRLSTGEYDLINSGPSNKGLTAKKWLYGLGILSYEVPMGRNSTGAYGWYKTDTIVVGAVVASHTGSNNPPYNAWRKFDNMPQEQAGADLGVTKPSACLFYFGQPIADQNAIVDPDGEATATPNGPVTVGEPPPPNQPPTYDPPTPPSEDPAAPGECEFSLTNPLTYFSGLGCLLSSLFVPDDLPNWGDVPSPLPPGWLPDLGSVSSAGCGPLSFPRLSLGWNDWTVGPVTYANTCDDPWPLVRTLTYNGLLVAALGSAAWMGFRALTSGLGIGVTTGGGDDDDR